MSPEPWQLCLYVAGMNPKTEKALAAIERICKEQLDQDYSLEVVDLLEHPEMAESEQILATPTLVRKRPLPLRKLIGDFSDTANVLAGLDLPSELQANS